MLAEHDWEPLLLHRTPSGIASKKPCPDDHLIGKKAAGLLLLPKVWTLPFIIVSSELYDEWRSSPIAKRNNVLDEWIRAIESTIVDLRHIASSPVIIRSSGQKEGMSSRGRYYSLWGDSSTIADLVAACLEKLDADPQVKESNVGLIIQRFVNSRSKGHLSNERRCYEERRDWLAQTEQQGSKPQRIFPVPVRKWRTADTGSNADESCALACKVDEAIAGSLKTVAGWFYTKSENRYHLEWVWDGCAVFIVQADEEDPTIGVDPNTLGGDPITNNSLANLSLIEPLNDTHASRYGKIRNVEIYRSLGLPTVPLFVLDDSRIIEEIANGVFSPTLEHDLELLVRSPLVIRTDLVEEDRSKKQLLKRSDELRTLGSVKEWLIGTAKSLATSGDHRGRIAFIFHNFIPATSSAFVYAEPGNRFVQIEGLWGLPEGLYYNSHDQFMVDTLHPNIQDAASLPFKRYQIHRRCNFKNFFVAPDDTGRWTRQIVCPPFDWRSSIPKDVWLQKMAISSRRIAEKEGKALSIMWFVGVTDSKRSKDVMPWFHEPFDRSNIHGQPIHERHKNVWDVSFEVLTSQDLTRLEEMASADPRDVVKRIKVSPIEDQLLRDRHALQKIGNLAKALDATIVLEGAILSHAYYQLVSTGAIVEVVHPFIGFEEKHEFNKLVRDKIPERIQRFGESVVAGRLDPSALLTALKTKLIEEAYEVQNASDTGAIIEELADIQEVVLAILESVGGLPEELEGIRKEKEETRGGFKQGLVLLTTTKGVSSSGAGTNDNQLAGISPDQHETSVSINKASLIELSEKVDRWGDMRTGEHWQESITTLQVPVAKGSWEAATRPVKTENSDQSVIGKVSAIRKADKIHVELKVQISSPEPDLFSPRKKLR